MYTFIDLHAALIVTSERRRSTLRHILPVSVNSISPSRRPPVRRPNSPKISLVAAARTESPLTCLLLATITSKTKTPRRRFAATGRATLRVTSNSVSAPSRLWRNACRPTAVGSTATRPTGWWKGSSDVSKIAGAFLRRRPSNTQTRHPKEKKQVLSAPSH